MNPIGPAVYVLRSHVLFWKPNGNQMETKWKPNGNHEKLVQNFLRVFRKLLYQQDSTHQMEHYEEKNEDLKIKSHWDPCSRRSYGNRMETTRIRINFDYRRMIDNYQSPGDLQTILSDCNSFLNILHHLESTWNPLGIHLETEFLFPEAVIHG